MNTISSQNPFFETYSTLHGTVPFDKIKTGDYVPAIREGIRRQNAEIEAIIRNPEVPTFANTVLAYEKSGSALYSAICSVPKRTMTYRNWPKKSCR